MEERIAEWLFKETHPLANWASCANKAYYKLRSKELMALIFDDNQELPENKYPFGDGTYDIAQQDMIKAGWRKVRDE